MGPRFSDSPDKAKEIWPVFVQIGSTSAVVMSSMALLGRSRKGTYGRRSEANLNRSQARFGRSEVAPKPPWVVPKHMLADPKPDLVARLLGRSGPRFGRSEGEVGRSGANFRRSEGNFGPGNCWPLRGENWSDQHRPKLHCFIWGTQASRAQWPSAAPRGGSGPGPSIKSPMGGGGGGRSRGQSKAGLSRGGVRGGSTTSPIFRRVRVDVDRRPPKLAQVGRPKHRYCPASVLRVVATSAKSGGFLPNVIFVLRGVG